MSAAVTAKAVALPLHLRVGVLSKAELYRAPDDWAARAAAAADAPYNLFADELDHWRAEAEQRAARRMERLRTLAAVAGTDRR
jgi:hypothetical protein